MGECGLHRTGPCVILVQRVSFWKLIKSRQSLLLPFARTSFGTTALLTHRTDETAEWGDVDVFDFFLGCQWYSLGGLFRSLCLSSVCLSAASWLWLNGIRYAYSVYRSRIGMWERHFDLQHFWHLGLPQPPNGDSNWWGGIIWHWNFGQIAADRAKHCIERCCEVVDGLSIGASETQGTQVWKSQQTDTLCMWLIWSAIRIAWACLM